MLSPACVSALEILCSINDGLRVVNSLCVCTLAETLLLS